MIHSCSIVLVHRRLPEISYSSVLLFNDFYSHHIPIHPSKAVLVFLVPAHEVEFVATVFAAPLDGLRQ